MRRSFAVPTSLLALALLAAPLVHCAAGGDTTPDAARDASTSHDAARDDGADATSVMDVPTTMDAADDPITPDVPATDTAPMQDVSTTDARDAAAADTMRPDVCAPTTEVCNGLDDDCDGMVDESGCPGHLLISEIVLAPNAGEFIEIYNPTDVAVALDTVYLTDTAVYPRSIDALSPPTIDASDFVARFPSGAAIAPHTYQTVATGNPSGWPAEFAGSCPTYHLQTSALLGACSASRVMRPLPVGANSIGMTATMTNTGEPVTLFTWDGIGDLVRDIDYVYPGAPTMSGGSTFNEAVDKSMLFVDGPDGDTIASGYQLDTPPASQSFAPMPAAFGAAVRCGIPSEAGELLNGGNGVSGHNETSEPLASTWRVTTPTPADGGITPVNATPNVANLCP